jgi:hypothetical protein
VVRLTRALRVLGFCFAFPACAALAQPGELNHKVTPGAVATTSARVVCAPKYARDERNVSYAVRDAVYYSYGIPRGRYIGGTYVGERRNFVIDHLIPLELGGSNARANLWPQPRTDALAKDRVEDALHTLVCDGRLSLTIAQRAIAADWRTSVPAAARFSRSELRWLDRPRSYSDD